MLLITFCVLSQSGRNNNHPIPSDPELLSIFGKGNAEFVAGRYVQAEKLFRAGITRARAAKMIGPEGRFYLGVASCRSNLRDYSTTAGLYLRARELAHQSGDALTAGLAAAGLHNAYMLMADSPTAKQYIREAQSISLDALPVDQRTRVRINLAVACASTKSQDCDRLFTTALDDALDSADLWMLSLCHRKYGVYLRDRGLVNASAREFVEAFRIRALTRSKEIVFSHIDLAELRLLQGDPRSALTHATSALSAGQGNPSVSRFRITHLKAKAELALDKLPAALQDFEAALADARKWYGAISPSDSTRTESNVWLQALYSDYVAAGMRQYAKTHDLNLAWRLFNAAEENRALSFRLKLLSQAKMTSEYWQTLAEMRNVEQGVSAGKGELVVQLRLKLNEMEAQAGILTDPPVRSPQDGNENIPSGKSLSHFRRLLSPDEALVSFHLGDAESYVWAMTGDQFAVHSLPARGAIAAAVHAFRSAVETDSRNRSAVSAELYRILFNHLSPQVHSRSRWIVILDDVLFQAPLGALVVNGNSRAPEYLIERHSLRTLPSGAMLGTRPPQNTRNLLLAVGDPIFNTADPRWTGASPVASRVRAFSLTAAPRQTQSGLARLAGTGREIRVCARAWTHSPAETILLEGARANRLSIFQALERGPAVVHLATHVVQADKNADAAYLAIGLDRSGVPDFLIPAELSNRHFALGIVTLSACSSGAGLTYRGAGLFGLTRAWLLAGAQAVVATHWPIDDDSGEMFQPFYSDLRASEHLSSAAAAQALQRAQVHLIHSGSWRAQPRYWSSFFVIGKD